MKKLNNHDVDKRLLHRNIIRIDNYINMSTKITFRCEKCKYLWGARPSDILIKKSGCPSCCKQIPITNEIIDLRLVGRNIKRLDNFYRSKSHLKFECLVCNYIWRAFPDNIVNGMRGCPNCVNKAKLTNEIIDLRLLNRSVKRVEDYINCHKKIKFKCSICSFIWMATPSSIIHLENGCPQCRFGKNEKLIRSILTKNNINFESHKSIKNIVVGESKNIIVDFYLKSSNTIIEYNGVQHYKLTQFGNMSLSTAEQRFIKQQERDFYLENFCNNNQIKLIWIDGRSLVNSKLENFIYSEIIPIIQKDANE